MALHPVKRLNLHWRYRLVIQGTGADALTDPSGVLLDGRNTGLPGSNFEAILHGYKGQAIRPTPVAAAARHLAVSQRRR